MEEKNANSSGKVGGNQGKLSKRMKILIIGSTLSFSFFIMLNFIILYAVPSWFLLKI